MVNPTHRNTTGVTPRNAATAIERTADTLSSSRNNNTTSQIDDVIGSLANAYENKRARQVNEWERLWRQDLSEKGLRAIL